MAGSRDILRRIRSVKNTQQITKAMKAVSASKLKKAQAAMLAARPYANKLVTVLGNLAARAPREYHPLLAHRGCRRIEFLVMTSDRGLCAAFNTNIMKRAVALYNEKKTDGCDLTLNIVGRKGRDYLTRRGYEIRKDWTGISGHLNYSHASMIAAEIIENYINAEVDEVYVIYNEFKSALSQTVIAEKILPIETPRAAVEADFWRLYLRAFARRGARDAASEARGVPDLQGAPGIGGLGAWGQDDRDGRGVQQCQGDDSEAHAKVQQGAPGGNHQGAYGDYRRRRSAEVAHRLLPLSLKDGVKIPKALAKIDRFSARFSLCYFLFSKESNDFKRGDYNE